MTKAETTPVTRKDHEIPGKNMYRFFSNIFNHLPTGSQLTRQLARTREAYNAPSPGFMDISGWIEFLFTIGDVGDFASFKGQNLKIHPITVEGNSIRSVFIGKEKKGSILVRLAAANGEVDMQYVLSAFSEITLNGRCVDPDRRRDQPEIHLLQKVAHHLFP